MISGLAFVEIVVRDFQLSIGWYTNILGFAKHGEIITNEDGVWCQLTSRNGNNQLALWQPSSLAPIPAKHPSIIPIFTVTDLRSFVNHLMINGVVFLEDIRERSGYLITTIADPDGNQLQLFEKTI